MKHKCDRFLLNSDADGGCFERFEFQASTTVWCFVFQPARSKLIAIKKCFFATLCACLVWVIDFSLFTLAQGVCLSFLLLPREVMGSNPALYLCVSAFSLLPKEVLGSNPELNQHLRTMCLSFCYYPAHVYSFLGWLLTARALTQRFDLDRCASLTSKTRFGLGSLRSLCR